MNRKLKNWIMAVPAGVVAVLSFAVCAGLGIASLFVLANMKTEEFSEHIPDELVITARNVPHTLAGAALVGAGGAFVCRGTDPLQRGNDLSCGGGVGFVRYGRVLPRPKA